ncbi:MAG: ABC transporter permease subunit [Rhodospirillales bacterium]|jgi:ABC-2 type transport system permease protein|nr:ABC transporter permease subunit [Rhodospirillales bacterium]MDP6805533.1 ABC transporter permease subunit [Rhodospirillales bacterium]
MANTLVIFRREFQAYFSTPLAYVFIVIFLALTGALTFYMGNFFGRGQADLQSFFFFHPWLYLFLIPSVTMRLWAEERKSGTIEVLMTLPVTTTQAVLGKVLAAWAFVVVTVTLTFPVWITVNYLGDPDNGVIVAGYVGSFLMAGAYLAIGACASAMTRNQVIAFIVAAVLCFLFLTSGLEIVLAFFRGWAPAFLVDVIASMSFLTHFANIAKGVIDLKDLIYFASVIGFALFVNVAIVEFRKGA